MATISKNVGIRRLLIGVGILIVLVAGVVMLAPRTMYYVERADYHAQHGGVSSCEGPGTAFATAQRSGK